MNRNISTDRLIRFFQATPEQQAAIDRILAAPPEASPLPASSTGGEREDFDEIERRLSLALDALLNAIDAYREQKKGRGA